MSKKYEYEGESLTLKQWGERLGVTKSAMRHRIVRGWSDEETFTTSKWGKSTQNAPPRMIFAGETYYPSELAQLLEIPLSTLHRRVAKGLDVSYHGDLRKFNRFNKGRKYEAFGKYLTIQQWCDEVDFEISPQALRTRFKYGWSVEKAVSTPIYGKAKVSKHHAAVKTPKDPSNTSKKWKDDLPEELSEQELIIQNLRKSGLTDEQILQRYPFGL